MLKKLIDKVKNLCYIFLIYTKFCTLDNSNYQQLKVLRECKIIDIKIKLLQEIIYKEVGKNKQKVIYKFL